MFIFFFKEELEKGASQQQLKPSRPQASSLMKGLNRSTSNRINLSSDILKVKYSSFSIKSILVFLFVFYLDTYF
jgi:hypothetical protein